ncbi:hypothetical protein SFC65_19635 [Priestia filamentosa]|uniref:hypothetical protein n=1 Tax=Priestia filamentosa TaxID=1402861 RepID=UPI003981EF1B
MIRKIKVVEAIPNAHWTGEYQTCLLAVSGTNILSAVCVKEPNTDETYEKEILRVSHTDILLGHTVVLGQFYGGDFRDRYINGHWDNLEGNGLDRYYLAETLKPYKI